MTSPMDAKKRSMDGDNGRRHEAGVRRTRWCARRIHRCLPTSCRWPRPAAAHWRAGAGVLGPAGCHRKLPARLHTGTPAATAAR